MRHFSKQPNHIVAVLLFGLYVLVDEFIFGFLPGDLQIIHLCTISIDAVPQSRLYLVHRLGKCTSQSQVVEQGGSLLERGQQLLLSHGLMCSPVG